MSSLTGSYQDIVQELGGAASSLFSSQGNAAQAQAYSGAAALATQNAQLSAASTRIQSTQVARQVSQSLGTTVADVAGAGFTTSGSALDILKSSAQQGALAKSLTNIQGAINENAYAAQAGAYTAEAKAAKEASSAGTISAIASLGGALVGGAGKLASAGDTVAKGYDYINSLFSGGASTEANSIGSATALPGTTAAAPIADAGSITSSDLPMLSATDQSVQEGATFGVQIDTSSANLIGQSANSVSTAVSDAAGAISTELGTGADAVFGAGAGAAIGDALSGIIPGLGAISVLGMIPGVKDVPVLGPVIGAVNGVVSGIENGVISAFSDIGSAIGDFFSGW